MTTPLISVSNLPAYSRRGLRIGIDVASVAMFTLMIPIIFYWLMTDMTEATRAFAMKILLVVIFLSLAAGTVTGCAIHAKGTADEGARRKKDAAALAHERALAPRLRVLNGTGDRYALEIRGLGLAVENFGQDGVWNRIDRLKTTRVSVLPQDIRDYPLTMQERWGRASRAAESIADSVGVDAVSNWPIPGFAALPPSHPSSRTAAGQKQAGEIRRSGLVYTYTLTVDESNGEDASALIDKLFGFFDAHPEVPQAIVLCRDGDTIREMIGKRGIGTIEGPHKPVKALSMVGLLVTRTDRVDRFIRPYAIKEKIIARSPDQLEYDYMKLYKFYWAEDHAWADKNVDKYASTTLPADYWFSRLPDFLRTIDDEGAPGFERTNFLPLRWTNWQVGLFDYPPIMGYLHRPITVRLTDDESNPLTDDARVAALRAGWARAVGTLAVDEAPMRVFRDTHYDHGITKVLAGILKEQPAPLDLDDVDQGIDIGVRIGDTGIASPFIQIALGTMASYKLGGPSAAVYRRENGDVTFTMVSPPDAETKAAWKHGNPFYAHVGR